MIEAGFGEGWRAARAVAGEHEWFWRERGPEGAPALALLHGFPQTGAIWAPFVAALDALGAGAGRRILVPDLPGYGRSRTKPGAAAQAKRAWAASFVDLLDSLGVESVDIVGHDRGGRLAYRFALDHPERVRRLGVLDILPTSSYWAGLAAPGFGLRIYHWMFLAQPSPLPETLIGAKPAFYIEDKLARWAGVGDLSIFSTEALEQYRENARDPVKLAAMCDDYRAGATLDLAIDQADEAAGRKIAAPTLALWGSKGLADKSASPLEVWRRWCVAVDGEGLDCGHFLPEERPAETAAAAARFLSG